MKLNHDELKKLMRSLGWTEVRLAKELKVDYSYLYRVMREQRGIGKKFLTGLMRLCEKKGLNYQDYIILEQSKIFDKE